MFDSKQTKLIAAVVGGAFLAKYFSPKLKNIFGQKCSLCGEDLSLSRQIFRWSHKPGLKIISWALFRYNGSFVLGKTIWQHL